MINTTPTGFGKLNPSQVRAKLSQPLTSSQLQGLCIQMGLPVKELSPEQMRKQLQDFLKSDLTLAIL